MGGGAADQTTPMVGGAVHRSLAAARLNRAAFTLIYQQEIGWVLNTLRRLGVASADLHDEAQKVFTAVWRQRDSYDPQRPIRPWLFVFAYRSVRDHRRASWRRRAVLDVVEAVSDAPGADEVVEAARIRALVLASLSEMDLDRRAVFVMNDVDGASSPAAAEALGIPLGTVYSRLLLARADFAAALNPLRRRRGER